jgi:hypothetical protein
MGPKLPLTVLVPPISLCRGAVETLIFGVKVDPLDDCAISIGAVSGSRVQTYGQHEYQSLNS